VLVDLGKVHGAYGVKGWVKITPFSEGATVLRKAQRWWLKRGEAGESQLLNVEAVRQHGGMLVAKWTGYETPEACNAIKGATVAVYRSDFPNISPNECYWVDLIGARVENRDAEVLGHVQGVRNYGAQDLMEVQTVSGDLILIPMVEDYIDALDVSDRLVRVDWARDWS